MAGIVPVILNKGRYAPDCVGADAPAKENELKNYLMFALLICATASMAFGQFGVVVDPAKVDVACPDDECHVAPVFMGEGGFVGELADGFDMANFVVTCGNTTASGSAAGDGGGVVRQLFSMANGLACHSDDGSIQIHGLADGGWYWINDDMNSAVSPLIAKDALMGDEVMPTDPGGVTLMASDYGTYVKSGDRVGILPHFVPTAPVEIPEIPEPEAATVCMPEWDPTARSGNGGYYANSRGCMLGDGGTKIVMTAMMPDGRSREVTSIHRNPSGGPDIEITLDLWANESGHIASGTNPHLGWGSLSVPSWYQPKPAPFNMPARKAATRTTPNEGFQLSWGSADGGLGTGLADAGISISGGRMMEVVSEGDPAPGGLDNPGTPAREDGYYKASDSHAPQCKQNVREETDGANVASYFLQFQAETGDGPVEIAIVGDDMTGSVAGYSDAPDLPALATWLTAHNNDPNKINIKSVRVKAGVGPDGDVAETADNTYLQLPAVVCDTLPGEKSMRYVDAVIEVSSNTDYCNRDNNRSATVNVLAFGAQEENATTPKIAAGSSGWRTNLNAITTLQVHCAE